MDLPPTAGPGYHAGNLRTSNYGCSIPAARHDPRTAAAATTLIPAISNTAAAAQQLQSGADVERERQQSTQGKSVEQLTEQACTQSHQQPHHQQQVPLGPTQLLEDTGQEAHQQQQHRQYHPHLSRQEIQHGQSMGPMPAAVHAQRTQQDDAVVMPSSASSGAPTAAVGDGAGGSRGTRGRPRRRARCSLLYSSPNVTTSITIKVRWGWWFDWVLTSIVCY